MDNSRWLHLIAGTSKSENVREVINTISTQYREYINTLLSIDISMQNSKKDDDDDEAKANYLKVLGNKGFSSLDEILNSIVTLNKAIDDNTPNSR